MTLADTVNLAIRVVLLGLAAHVLAVNLKDDWVPFGDIRIRIWKKCPAPNMVVSGGWDYNDLDDREHFQPKLRHKIGYLLTCPFCLGFYPSIVLGIAYLLAPIGTIHVAFVLDIWALQRIFYPRFATR